jgi:type 1 glutamine amidotransferase
MRHLAGTAILASIVALSLGQAARSADAAPKPLRIHMLSGSAEYKSEASLKAFKEHLEKTCGAAVTLSLGQDGGADLPDLDQMDQADVLVVFCRRMKLPKEQLDRIRKWCADGKPVVGIRTASHAFGGWPTFDKEIQGGDYKGHGAADPQVKVAIDEKAKDHPILTGVKEWTKADKLYTNRELAKDATVLLTGTGKTGSQPLAWCRTYNPEKNGRCFYTSMGFPDDFANEDFQRLLVNALHWVAGRQPAAK